MPSSSSSGVYGVTAQYWLCEATPLYAEPRLCAPSRSRAEASRGKPWFQPLGHGHRISAVPLKPGGTPGRLSIEATHCPCGGTGIELLKYGVPPLLLFTVTQRVSGLEGLTFCAVSAVVGP